MLGLRRRACQLTPARALLAVPLLQLQGRPTVPRLPLHVLSQPTDEGARPPEAPKPVVPKLALHKLQAGSMVRALSCPLPAKLGSRAVAQCGMCAFAGWLWHSAAGQAWQPQGKPSAERQHVRLGALQVASGSLPGSSREDLIKAHPGEAALPLLKDCALASRAGWHLDALEQRTPPSLLQPALQPCWRAAAWPSSVLASTVGPLLRCAPGATTVVDPIDSLDAALNSARPQSARPSLSAMASESFKKMVSPLLSARR